MADFTRSNAWKNGGTFDNKDLYWYAIGVQAMMARSLDNTASWWFFAAIHGEYVTPESLKNPRAFPWSEIPGAPAVPIVPLPAKATYITFWNQCQHGSWYFLPWHRGYLLALEAQIREEIKTLGGPSTWALPYWNYFGPAQEYDIPPAFTAPTLPNGSPNPLLPIARYGPMNSADQANIWVATEAGIQNHPPIPTDLFYGPVTLDSMNQPIFAGDNRVPEFGGPQTGFNHSSGTHGDLEANPHDLVHVYVGGTSPDGSVPGLMSVPALAGLDPIFYLHHANIDRLWASWNVTLGNPNPTDPTWLNGPAAGGNQEFVMPWPGIGKWIYTPRDMGNFNQLDYTYDDLTRPGGAVNVIAERLVNLGAAIKVEGSKMSASVPEGKNIELVGASLSPLRVEGEGAHTLVRLQPEVRRQLTASLEKAAVSSPPDRVILNLENVRGTRDTQILNVFINLPPNAKPAEHPELLAGSVGLFGITDASFELGDHGGEGLNFALDISKVVDKLHLGSALDSDSLGVTIVPNKTIADEDQITIGKVSIFRKGL
ncbi:tyrosinase family protein [Terriglobus saanensis]|uniref:Tyrosinase n=1 Tax=Terriglobus saanensis (strain ATCC BAA-1853 / DSM 23119 / SP1PR4) TaxID=401053 RepID=E8UXU0_TERSS|nr:tyrosinase family protein [Terriglobus saanensis]ADV83106.1 tyrosinase [Terriglobus saanensis SP1PR4]